MTESEKLRAAIDKVRAIHKPIRVYDECNCGDDAECNPIEV